MDKNIRVDLKDMFRKMRDGLSDVGLEVQINGNTATCSGEAGGAKVKVVCVAPGLRESVEEMSKTARDQVVMVRVDEETSETLDAWVKTGAVKSRSEAAALFIREGLKIRADELDKLGDALKDLEDARERLQAQAKEVFGDES